MLKALLQKILIVPRKQTKVSGFTLIELLVSIVIASIVVGTLLGFVVSILERDRTEQAKVEAQEESQAALNYIADDMTEAVYIYDADGLYRTPTGFTNNIFSQLPHNFRPAGATGCNAANCSPVLVFWKRYTYDRDDLVTGGDGSSPNNRAVRCLQEPSQTAASCTGGNQYIYSLVVYYLLKDANIGWSGASRIVRWEIKDGITWGCRENSTLALADPARCPINANQRIQIPATTGTVYAVAPDPGFTRFNLAGVGTLSDRMNRWRKGTANYDFNVNGFEELVDFVDDTPYSPAQDDGTIGNSPNGARVDINIIGNTDGTFTTTPIVPSKNLSCDNPDIGVGVGRTLAQVTTDLALNPPIRNDFAQRIPANFGTTIQNPKGLSSFYACVNASKVSARVYLRSNALARLRDNISSRPVSDGIFQSFLPTANVRVFGRGVLSIE